MYCFKRFAAGRPPIQRLPRSGSARLLSRCADARLLSGALYSLVKRATSSPRAAALSRPSIRTAVDLLPAAFGRTNQDLAVELSPEPWRGSRLAWSGSNDRDRVHLDEEVGVGEALDDGGRDDRRIGSVAPHALERRVAGTEVLAVDDEDAPLHDVLRPGIGGCQGRAQVAQDLLGLCGDVADADDVPLGVDRVLAADVDR